MENKNLWQLTNKDDLKMFVKNNVNKHMMLALALYNNDYESKSIVKKFIKKLSKVYENVMFIYYDVQQHEYKSISKMMSAGIDINEKMYPLIHCIYNTSDLLLTAPNADNVDTLSELTEKTKSFYDPDDGEENAYDDGEEQANNEPETPTKSEPKPEQKPEHKTAPKPGPKPGPKLEQIAKQKEPDPELQQQERLLNKKRLLDKIIFLKDKAAEYQIEFLKDIQQRKLNEKEN